MFKSFLHLPSLYFKRKQEKFKTLTANYIDTWQLPRQVSPKSLVCWANTALPLILLIPSKYKKYTQIEA